MNSSENSNFLPLGSAGALKNLAALILLCVGAYLYFPGVFSSFNERLFGGFGGDAGIYLWLAKRNYGELFSRPWFHTNAFYPYNFSLAWSDNFIAPSFAFGAIRRFAESDIGAWNLLMLGALVLNGWSTFRLIYSISARFVVSIAAGICSISFLPIASHLGHPQLVFFFPVAFFLLAILRFLNSRSLGSAFSIGILVVLTFLTSVYYAVFEGLLLLTFFTALWLVRPGFFSKASVYRLLFGVILGFLPVVPFALPYLKVKAVFGARGLYESFYFSANSSSYLSSTEWSRWWSGISNISHHEASLFGGVSILLGIFLGVQRLADIDRLKRIKTAFIISSTIFLLASFVSESLPILKWLVVASGWGSIVSLGALLRKLGVLEKERGVSTLTNRAMIGILLFCLLIFLFCSFGPLGNPEKGQLAPGFYSLLYYTIPGFEGLRAISRAGIISMYFVLLLYFISIWRLLETSKNPNIKVLLLLLLILPCWEQSLSRYPLDPLPPTPELVSQNVNGPKPEVAIALPYSGEINSEGSPKSWTDFASKNVTYMNWFFRKNVWLVNGYSGIKSKIIRELPRALANFPDDKSIRALSSLGGLSKIYVFPSMISDFNESVFTSKVALYKERLQILERDPNGNYLISLKPRLLLGGDFSLAVPGDAKELELSLEKTSTCPPTPVSLTVMLSGPQNREIANLTLEKKAGAYRFTAPYENNAKWLSFKTPDCPLYFTGIQIR